MWEYAKEWAQIAPGFTPLVAVAAVLLACRVQLVLNRYNQRETTAKATFREYLKLAVQYPELSSADFQSLKGDQLERYEWFVGCFLSGPLSGLLELETLDKTNGDAICNCLRILTESILKHLRHLSAGSSRYLLAEDPRNDQACNCGPALKIGSGGYEIALGDR